MGSNLIKVTLCVLVILFWESMSPVQAASESSEQPVTTESAAAPEDCQMSEAAREAIDDAAEAWMKAGNVPEALELILQAVAATEPPDCDNTKALEKAGQAIELVRISFSEAPIDLSFSEAPYKTKKSSSPVLGLNFGVITFEDEIFSGSGRMFGLTLGGTINSHYEIGYEYNSNAAFDFIFDDPFLSEPSLDKGPELGTFEDIHITSHMLFLRGNWPIGEKITGFALIGYSKIQIETEEAVFDCGPLFPLVPICLNEDGIGATTTYRNKASGIAWGVGLEWKRGLQSYLSLKYIDHSVDDIDLSGIYLAWGLRD